MNVLDDFDFIKVHKTMKQLRWCWAFSIAGESVDKVPSIANIIMNAKYLLANVFEYQDEDYHSISSGGLEASIHDGILSLKFVLEEQSSDNI